MRRILPVLVAGLLVAAFAAPASASYTTTWHRNSYGTHERLVCTITSGLWQCRQETVVPTNPQGNQGDQGNGPSGAASFRGSEQAGSCPSWAGDVCTHVDSYVVGETIYGLPDSPFTMWVELILTDGAGVAPLYAYLTGPAVEDPFPAVCPWYRTWQAAQADPDCFFHPAD